ncbi:MAG: ornithine cyclodeaminase family protein [Comamonas sp.]
MLHITDGMIDALISPDEALEAMRAAFVSFGRGEAAMQSRERTDAGGVKLSTLGAVIPALGVTGAKVYTTLQGQFNFVILLFSTETGAPLATMEANAITRLRTAATTLLAAEYLAPSQPQQLFLCGAGVQGAAHAQQLARHFPLKRIQVFDPYADDAVVARLQATCGVPVIRVKDTQAVGDAEMVVTASRSTTPLFAGERIADGAFVAAIGSSLPHTRELDDAALQRASAIVVEWRKQAAVEAGDLVLASADVDVSGKLVELGALLNGQAPQRPAGSQISLYKAVGVGLEDIALAGLAYRKHGARA